MDNKRFGVLFDTFEDSHYYFDSGTGKVVSCNLDEKELINKILSNAISVEEAFELDKEFEIFAKKEKLFSKQEWHFMLPTIDEFKELIEGKCEQIVLELTEACNLRCEYCIYHEHHPNHRKFSNKNMTDNIAKRSIDYILSNYRRDEFALTFYGGEPLINFPLMKECMEYVRNRYSNIKLSYGFTTNLTLLTDEMIEFFNSFNNIDIVCSIDGPKELHDNYRKNICGEGSFDIVIENFFKLIKKFYNPDKKRGLSINCVITPPYDSDKLNKISEFFYNDLSIPKDIHCNYSYVDKGNMKFDVVATNQDTVSPLENVATNDFLKNKEDSKLLKLISVELSRVARRFVSEDGFLEYSYLHGNCVPGQRRMYVTVDGDFKPCEKVGRAPILGNYIKGYNFKKNYNTYIKKYAEYFEKLCNNCWARTMCGVCYESTLDGIESEPYVSGNICNTSRKILKDMFVNYYRILEIDREGLKRVLSKLELR